MTSNRPIHAPPQARRAEVVETIHGVPVRDPYRWLEDASDPEVRAWMDVEDAHARAALAALPLREPLRARFTELFYVDWVSAPVRRAGRSFYMRRTGAQEKAVLCWKDAGHEHVLVDPNRLSPDGSISLGTWAPSYDGRYVAYAVRRNAADSATLLVRDVALGSDLPLDRIVDAKYASPSWLPDSSGFYYTWLPSDPSIAPAELPGRAEVRFHALGTDPAADPALLPALRDPKAFVYAEVSRDGRWVLLFIQHGWTRTDVWFKARSAGSPAALPVTGSTPEELGFQPLFVGADAQAGVVAHDGWIYLATNDGAPRYRVYRVDPARPQRGSWDEIVPESAATLDNVQVVGGHLVLHFLDNASSRLEVRTLAGAPVRRVELPELGTTSGMVGNPDEDEAYFSFTSFTQVPQIFRTSIASGVTTLWETIRVPADTSVLTVEQVFYPSKDGTRVSMFLVHRRDLARDGKAPVLLTGYGGFAVNMTPSFRSTAVVWVERGGVVAIPNLRGGGEYGDDWHRAGMLENKQRVFDDFIAAAEFLVAEGYTRPDKLAAVGGSNGGLLVGAAMVQRPDLFRAIVCSVPLLDMVRYHHFGSGMTWTQEYGSADDPGQFRALYAYSPYHGLVPGTSYPALLMLSADSDDRVDPMHARKFAAAVRHASSAPHAVLLRVGRNSGHTGADLVKEQVEQQADQFAFLLHELGER